jgi:iron(II)-dependent oxidoreductase
MSPLVWDLGHIAAYEDLWLAHRYGGLDLLRMDLAEVYDAFETPRSVRGSIELLGRAEALAYLEEVRERTSELVSRSGVGDGTIFELVLRHELQHSETMRQTLAIAGLLPAGEPRLGPLGGEDGWIAVPGGPFAMGSGPEGFAYDNERPRHLLDIGPFQIARRPVSNGSWMRFSEGGGYERREWWSAEGWAWKQEYDITRHPDVAAGDPDSPVCHVSWFEADAFARAHGARLPTEAEWEKAATAGARERPGSDGEKAPNAPNADEKAAATAGARERPGSDGESVEGLVGVGLVGVGLVWEWTQSPFGGYPGFIAHPYREYSEVFFGDEYRVLRGGSWATDARIASPRFRNWDLPIRRQIFSGVRLARDGEL